MRHRVSRNREGQWCWFPPKIHEEECRSNKELLCREKGGGKKREMGQVLVGRVCLGPYTPALTVGRPLSPCGHAVFPPKSPGEADSAGPRPGSAGRPLSVTSHVTTTNPGHPTA